MTASPADEALRVATWNLHGFIGRGRRPDPGRTLRRIADLRADIVALQEVDGRVHLGRRAGAFETLRDGLGGTLVEARLFGAGDHAYGHALWTRLPVLQSAVHPLPGPGLEPRACIEAIVGTRQGPLRVLAAHLALLPATRRRQARAVAALVRPDMPTIALGDFNEWRLGGAVHRSLAGVLPVAVRLPIWPARRPAVALDRLYASRGLAVHAEAVRAAADASDHLPLLASIDFSAV